LIRCDGLKRILIVGEVFVDRHISPREIRLGGIFHVARTLHALSSHYAAAWIAPAYLDDDCERYFQQLDAPISRKVGNVTGSPNLVEINDSAEAGEQRYVDLLRDKRRIQADPDAMAALIAEFRPTDIIVVIDTWTRSVAELLNVAEARVALDIDHWPDDDTIPLDTPPAIVFSSTSGGPFQRHGRNPEVLREHWRSIGIPAAILKENRGGSRAWLKGEISVEAPCFPTATRHSVGVGECFDAAWVAASEQEAPALRLRFASWIASFYAATFNHATFVDEVHTALTLDPSFALLEGVRLPWERRPDKNIYIAAPDFPTVDTRLLDELDAALRYHNFTPRRPILENGLADSSMSASLRRGLHAKDVALLEQCDLMIAVPISPDPGTFAELGWFSRSGKPTILFDPHRLARNFFVEGSAARVCETLGSVVDAVYEVLGRANL
jgi:nucleoside 2-deoxyribosyltransferase